MPAGSGRFRSDEVAEAASSATMPKMAVSRWRMLGLSTAIVALQGCAPPLSTFQTARVPPKGTWSAAAGFEGSIPLGTLGDFVNSGENLGSRAGHGETLSSEEKWQVFGAGMQLLLSPPSVGYHFMAAYVPTDRLEVSLRYAGSALRLGGRYQLLYRETAPFDMNVGLGIARYSYGIPMGSYIPVLKVDSFSRWQIDVPLLIGMQNRWFRAWTGPRFVATFFDAGLRLETSSQTLGTTLSGTAYFVGGQGGLGFGYRWLFVAFELTVVEMLGSAQANAPGITDSPTRDLALSGLVVYPSLGLMGEF